MAIKGTPPLSTQGVINLVAEEHGTGARGNPYVIMTGGKYVATPTALTDGDAGALLLDRYGARSPMGVAGQQTFLTTTGTNSDNAIKTSAGHIYMLDASNPTTADAYLQIFDGTTADTTLAVTTPKQSYLVPAGSGTKSGALEKTFIPPLKMGTAITYAFTLTVDGSGTVTGTGNVILNAVYD